MIYPTTTIKIAHETWKDLSALKNVGDSFDVVVKRLIEKVNGKCEYGNQNNNRKEL